jgi:hypothetical protein
VSPRDAHRLTDELDILLEYHVGPVGHDSSYSQLESGRDEIQPTHVIEFEAHRHRCLLGHGPQSCYEMAAMPTAERLFANQERDTKATCLHGLEHTESGLEVVASEGT